MRTLWTRLLLSLMEVINIIEYGFVVSFNHLLKMSTFHIPS